MAADFKPGQPVTICGDKRWKEPQPAVVLDARGLPLVQVRLGTSQYDTKAATHFVNASKLLAL